MKKKVINPEDISREDTIRLVRIAIKCADLLENYDTLEWYYKEKKSKYIKHEVKKPFERLGPGLDKFSGAFLKPFVTADQNTQMELQQSFLSYSKSIWFKTEEMTALVLLYAKVSSVYADLIEMEFEDIPLSYIKTLCKEFIDAVKNKYKTVFNTTDADGNGVENIIESLNILGKKIMYA
jgi:hypothetical protein